MAIDKMPELTPRERDVLRALCRPADKQDTYIEPASIKEMAAELFVSEAAIKQHLIRLYDKFGIFSDEPRRRVRLANEVSRLGLVDAGKFDASAGVDAMSLVARGRDALARGAWDEAYECLAAADRSVVLVTGDLERLGEAAVWSDHHAESIDARQRAHERYLVDGDRVAAARVAIALVPNHLARLNLAAASGWFNKAKRLLQDQPESVAHGELAAMTALIQLANGEIEPGLESAQTAHRLGEAFGDRDLVALGLVFQGYALARLGRIDDSAAFLDEAMASATAGELGTFATAIVYCRTISTCLDLFDYRRAAEWTDLVQRAADASGPVGVAGDCLTHQVAVKIFRGEWADGELEAERACALSAAWDLNHTALARYELGEIKLRTGDLAGAASAFRQANELGAVPQPGLALLRLAEGDVEGAAAAIAGSLAAAKDQLRRAALLPAEVEIALAAGDVERARLAAVELDGIAERYGSEALHAAAHAARGMLRLADGDPGQAIRDLRDSITAWQASGAPFEVARSRMLLATALVGIGDEGSARMETESALDLFRRLGAGPDEARAADMLGALSPT
jgi:ATP/maltotriose-dependent transcriptional regulator MalT